MPKQIEELHIMHSSLLFSNSAAQRSADINYALDQGPDLISFTESSEIETRQLITANCRAKSYAPIIWPAGDTQMAVKLGGSAHPRVKGQNGIMVSPAIPGSFGARYVRWVRVDWYDQDLWFHNAHWVFVPHVLQAHGELVNLHSAQTRTMAAQVKKHGQGEAISFFAGDINVDEGADNMTDNPNFPNSIFRQNGLLTIWDEFHVVPQATIANSVFDIIGCFRPDTQVKGKRYRVHPRQNSDHRPISAVYDVDVTHKVITGGGGGGNGGGGGRTEQGGGNQNPNTDLPADDIAVDPDFYATGGNISWVDYMDDTIYALPVARDDSQYGGE